MRGIAGVGLALALGVLALCRPLRADEPAAGKDVPDFNRDVRPILAENCLKCHGSDEKDRKAKLRLDVRDAALASPGVIVPNHAAKSALIERITSSDVEHRMPPARTGKTLTGGQIDVLRRWIDGGAPWSTHWAYLTPQRPALPVVKDAGWVRNPIDRFILARLEHEGLHSQQEASRNTLIRRLSLDLVGLPPTIAEVDAFLADSAPGAYERLVDRLLASSHFGEKMAQHWLDLARYGDSDGYHDDTPRVAYQYRDYVIHSFNANKPFDKFTVEQLAGDLLPNATLEEKIASSFHRLGPTSSEGGADAQEYLAKYAVDRVNTTATVWLGVTMHCAECHDHKFDPFTTKEYYQLFAFFNQVPEDALFRGNDAPPIIPTPTKDQQRLLEELSTRIAEGEKELKERLASDEPDPGQDEWEKKLLAGEVEGVKLSPWRVIGPFMPRDGELPPFDYAYEPEREIDFKATYESGKLKWNERPNFVDGKVHYLGGENCATYFHRTITSDRPQGLTLYLGSDDGIKLWINGKLVHSKILVRGVAPNQDVVTVVLEPGENRVLMKIVNLQGGYGFYFSTKEKARDERLEAVLTVVRKPAAERDAKEQRLARDYYRERNDPHVVEAKLRVAKALEEKGILERSIPRLRIMADMPQRRPTHVLVRGDFRTKGDEVQPAVPGVLGALPEGAKPDRLALARWLVDRRHPLTARVAVNHFWQWIFGHGLVRSAEDFGVRGDVPTHPELLDWLAVDLMESGWDVKRLLKMMVTSATYRQSSVVSRELQDRDPENKLLARGVRYRLPAETVRDNALAIAGLLDRQRPVGGPSVKPYQPGDLWREMAYGDSADKSYVQDHGPDLYRRGLYVYWKRSIHYPAFATFDAPNREVCVACRPVTNTPLQAFVLLNDVAFVEAARVFAQKVMKEGGESFDERIDFAYRQALARPPETREKAILLAAWQKLHERHVKDEKAAQALVSTGEWPVARDLPPAEQAAWTSVCQMILNLDETVSRE